MKFLPIRVYVNGLFKKSKILSLLPLVYKNVRVCFHTCMLSHKRSCIWEEKLTWELQTEAALCRGVAWLGKDTCFFVVTINKQIIFMRAWNYVSKTLRLLQR